MSDTPCQLSQTDILFFAIAEDFQKKVLKKTQKSPTALRNRAQGNYWQLLDDVYVHIDNQSIPLGDNDFF